MRQQTLLIFQILAFHLQPHLTIEPFPLALELEMQQQTASLSWLLLMNKLNTRNILKRNNHKLAATTAIVSSVMVSEKKTYHLLCACPFSQECWQLLGIHWNTDTQFYDMMNQTKDGTPHNFFMEIFIIAAW